MKLLIALGLLLCCWQGVRAREGYQVWSKERIRYYSTRVLMNPDNAQLRVLLGNAYYADGQVARAGDELRKAVKLQPRLAAAHSNLAVVLQAQGQFPEARTHFEEALRQDSSMVEARVGLGTLLCRMGLAGEGLVHLERALALDLGQQGVRYDLAVAYYQSGDYQLAISHLEKVLQVDSLYAGALPALGRAYYRLGLNHLQAKQAPQALACFASSLRYRPGDADLFFAKGLAYVAQHELAAAETALKEVVRLEEGYMLAYQELAALCEQTQRPQEAQYYYQQAQKWAPRWPMLQAVRKAQGEVGARAR